MWQKIHKPVRFHQITVPQGPVQLDGVSCEVTRAEESTCEGKAQEKCEQKEENPKIV